MPDVPLPQHLILPEFKTAQEKLTPELTERASERKPTVTGVSELTLPPLPRAPETPEPQHLPDPSERMAQVWEFPAETEIAEVRFFTAKGVEERFRDPEPVSPLMPAPQQRAEPSKSKAQPSVAEPASPRTFERLVMGVGSELLAFVPFPSWNELLRPQH